MSTFVSKWRERVIDPGDADQWIEIKAKLSRADEATYKDWLIKLAPGSGEFDFTTIDWETPLLKLAIVDWCIKDPDDPDKEVPFNASLIGDFDPTSPLVDAVLGKIGDLNPFFGFKTPPVEPSGTET